MAISTPSYLGISRRGFIAGMGMVSIALASGIALRAQASESSADSDAAEVSLDGKELNIYCGAGMTDPFQEIADAFQEQTGCTMNVTFANAANIQTQIETTQEGDFFIAGSKDEVERVSEYVDSQTDLVKHIPVLIVPESNPKGITCLADLANAEQLLLGDPESTAIGKVAKKALTDAGLWEQLNESGVITNTTTAPQIATALANEQGDAGIVWKENVTEGVSIVDTTDMDPYVKVIPAAHLTFSEDQEAADAFLDFLLSDEAYDIWAKYGYEPAEQDGESAASSAKDASGASDAAAASKSSD
jgi:molybdate transport system substrate-binding protein